MQVDCFTIVLYFQLFLIFNNLFLSLQCLLHLFHLLLIILINFLQHWHLFNQLVKLFFIWTILLFSYHLFLLNWTCIVVRWLVVFGSDDTFFLGYWIGIGVVDSLRFGLALWRMALSMWTKRFVSWVLLYINWIIFLPPVPTSYHGRMPYLTHLSI